MSDAVKLDAPGAGLPFHENAVLRYIIFPYRSATMSNQKALVIFDKLGRECLSIARSLNPDQLSRRVLIDRFPGIEDSSRHWSVALTIEHLLIAGQGMAGITESLVQGITELLEVKIQDVKPKGNIDPVVLLDSYQNLLDGFRARMTRLKGINTSTARHAHPWIGPLTARQWLVMNAMHNGIHLHQIKEIVKGL